MGHEYSLEKEMAIHSGILDWEIPWTGEPDGTIVHGVTKDLDITSQLNNNPIKLSFDKRNKTQSSYTTVIMSTY